MKSFCAGKASGTRTEGLEPTTIGFGDQRSTIELRPHFGELQLSYLILSICQ